MQHPFEGVIATSEPRGSTVGERADAPAAPGSRRSFLGVLAAVLGGTVLFSREAAAQGRFTTQALGEEGGRPRPGRGGGGERATTLALGEEGGRAPAPPPGRATTFAIGEEGGRGRSGWPR